MRHLTTTKQGRSCRVYAENQHVHGRNARLGRQSPTYLMPPVGWPRWNLHFSQHHPNYVANLAPSPSAAAAAARAIVVQQLMPLSSWPMVRPSCPVTTWGRLCSGRTGPQRSTRSMGTPQRCLRQASHNVRPSTDSVSTATVSKKWCGLRGFRLEIVQKRRYLRHADVGNRYARDTDNQGSHAGTERFDPLLLLRRRAQGRNVFR